MDTPFRMNIRHFGSGIVLDLNGDLTKTAEEEMLHSRSWDQEMGPEGKYLILNFTGMPYINSAGIAILIRLSRTGRKAGYKTFAFGLNAHYQKLFRVVGLTEYKMIYPDEYSVMQRIEALEQL